MLLLSLLPLPSFASRSSLLLASTWDLLAFLIAEYSSHLSFLYLVGSGLVALFWNWIVNRFCCVRALLLLARQQLQDRERVEVHFQVEVPDQGEQEHACHDHCLRDLCVELLLRGNLRLHGVRKQH